MARDIFCDVGACNHRAAFLLTALATGQTTAFCSDHFAKVAEGAIREFDTATPTDDVTAAVGPGFDLERLPLMAAVASEICDRLWAGTTDLDLDQIVGLNENGWDVTVPTFNPGTGEPTGTEEVGGIVLTPDELAATVGMVADAMAERAELPDVPAIPAVAPDSGPGPAKTKRSSKGATA